ncbi:MAG: SUMF1/EgtB/PvdO family nonheme iron enzyme [Phycisphaerales bacterium]|nr:SUMF1/EgtB/PvdO family nonheme iron enzyme [Phycisphaerales bacterium]
MAAGKLIRAILFVSGKIGVKKVAYAAGAQLGPGGGTWAESAVDVGLQFVEEICKCFGGANRESVAVTPVPGALNPDAQRQIKQQIAEVAQASGDELRREMAAAIDAEQPEMPADEREALVGYAGMLPERIRRSMRRPEDVSGRTIPEGKQFSNVIDVAEVLPPMPRFIAGQTPVYQCTLTRVLGVGTFGEVWEARKFGFETRRVALKFCLGDERALLHEANLAQRLEHPGIVALRAIHERSGGVPLSLEYDFVDGPDLAEWYLSQTISDADRPAFAANVIAELAEIVGAAHAHIGDTGREEPIAHRDLKPANILVPRVARGARFKITDFGIGGILRATEDAAAATRQRTLGRYGSSYTLDALQAHTPRYAPDEQVAGGAADPRQDIHALGVIWYQMLRRDFSLAAPRGAGWKRQLRDRGVADAHLELIERCVDSDPAERPESGAVLAAAICAEVGRVGRAHQSDADRASEKTVGTGHPTEAPRIVVPATPKIVTPARPQLVEARFPMTEAEAREVQTAAAKALGVPVMETLDLGAGVTLDMMLIPAGEFLMGGDQSPEEVARLGDSKAEYFKDEHPRHLVRISHPFRFGRFQVTQSQWQRVLGNNPSHFKGDPKLPVEQVSWDDCQQFCQKLSRDLGRVFRLPTEAEWEYSCRCGTGTAFHFGDTISTKQANYDGNYTYAGGSKGEYRQKTMPVGSFPANGWGLHDMHGNVWEWCADWKGEFEQADAVDPTGPGSGSGRVLRGGSWYSLPRNCRSAFRGGDAPGSRNNYVGFRVASGTK